MLNECVPKTCKKKFHYIEQLYMGVKLGSKQLRKNEYLPIFRACYSLNLNSDSNTPCY